MRMFLIALFLVNNNTGWNTLYGKQKMIDVW